MRYFLRTVTSVLFLMAFVLLPNALCAQDFAPGQLELPLQFGAASDMEMEVSVAATVRPLGEGTTEIQVMVTLPPECYTYSMNPSFNAATVISLKLPAGVTLSGPWKADRQPKAGFDDTLQQNVEKFHDKVTWTAVLTGALKAGQEISGELTGLYCSKVECRPIENATFTATAATSDGAPADTGTTPASEDSVSQNSTTQTVKPVIGFGKSAKAGPVEIEVSLLPANAKAGDEVILTLKTTVEDEWHIFALDQNPDMAGIPTTIELVKLSGLEPIDAAFASSSVPQTESPLPDITQRVHYGEITWTRRMKVTTLGAAVAGTIQFQICREGICKPPTTAEFQVSLPNIATATPQTSDPSSTNPEAQIAGTETASESGTLNKRGRGAPREGFMAFMITAVGAGFVALATPCVFPMIPITVAFFLKQEERYAGSSLKLAIVYCLSIIAAFTVLGLAMARIFGGSSLTDLANNPWLNLFFSGLFVLFALMLLGAMDLQVPGWLVTWTSNRESAGGMIGVVFMALTFTLVSFTCTFAFVGSLLVIAAQGDVLWPVLGMLGFSTAFASPFFILALFPRMLNKLPRSGGWMNDVKFVIGLVELAAVVKFLSVADIGLSSNGIPVFITYTGFLWCWILLSAASGFYLWGIFRKSGMRPKASLIRYAFVAAFLLFSGRLTAGLVGMKLPADPVWNLVAAFAPPEIKSGDVRQQDELGYVIYHHELPYSLEFPKAVAAAVKSQRPVFLEITGVNCVNCRQMERTVLAQQQVIEKLAGLVLTQAYLDQVPGIADAELQKGILKSNKELATDLLDDVTMPSYAIISPDGKQVFATFQGLDRSNGKEFMMFLEAGLDRWEKSRSPKTTEVP